MAKTKTIVWIGSLAFLVLTSAWAQEVEPVKPTQPTTGHQRPPVTQPKPTQPEEVLPSPETQCIKQGGEWSGNRCDLSKVHCQQEGKRWNDSLKRCESTQEEKQSVVPPQCNDEERWDGERCVTNKIPKPETSETPAEGGSGVLRTTTIAAGGVFLGAGVVTGILALVKKKDLNSSDACDDKHCYPSAKSDYDTGKKMANISTGTFAVGAVLLTAGLFLIPGGQEPEQEPGLSQKPSTKPSVDFAAGPDGGTLSARWIF